MALFCAFAILFTKMLRCIFALCVKIGLTRGSDWSYYLVGVAISAALVGVLVDAAKSAAALRAALAAAETRAAEAEAEARELTARRERSLERSQREVHRPVVVVRSVATVHMQRVAKYDFSQAHRRREW